MKKEIIQTSSAPAAIGAIFSGDSGWEFYFLLLDRSR